MNAITITTMTMVIIMATMMIKERKQTKINTKKKKNTKKIKANTRAHYFLVITGEYMTGSAWVPNVD